MFRRGTIACLLAAAVAGSCGLDEAGLAHGVGGGGGLAATGSGGVADSGWPDGSGGSALAGGLGGVGGSGGASGGAAGAADGGDADVSVGGDAGVGATGGTDAGDSGTGGATGWQPQSIPNCLLWLDAADASTVSLAGSTVQIWTEKCGGHAVSAAGNAKPEYVAGLLNGLSGVRFDGTDDTLEIGGTPKAAAAYVMFFVAKSKAAASAFPIWSNRHLSPVLGGTWTYFGLATQRLLLFQNNSSVPVLAGTVALGDSPHLLEVAVGPAGRQLVVDGVIDSVDGVVVVTATGLPGGAVAHDKPNTAFGGFDLFEVVMYDRDLSLPERATVRSALKTKWALP